MPLIPDLRQARRVLCVQPHYDDNDIGAGGTIAQWSAQGRKVVLVVCTNGDKGTSDRCITSEELVEIRQKEQRKAAEVLGIAEVAFLGYPDQGLEDSVEFRESLVRQIRTRRPETVMTIDPNRKYIRHRDHHNAGRVTLDAVFPYARDHLAYPEHLREGLEPHKVAEVWIMDQDNADQYVDVTDYIEIAIAALQSHVSQVGEDVAKHMRNWRSKTGKNAGFAYAEGFKRFRLG